jgi:hypothetical protein
VLGTGSCSGSTQWCRSCTSTSASRLCTGSCLRTSSAGHRPCPTWDWTVVHAPLHPSLLPRLTSLQPQCATWALAFVGTHTLLCATYLLTARADCWYHNPAGADHSVRSASSSSHSRSPPQCSLQSDVHADISHTDTHFAPWAMLTTITSWATLFRPTLLILCIPTILRQKITQIVSCCVILCCLSSNCKALCVTRHPQYMSYFLRALVIPFARALLLCHLTDAVTLALVICTKVSNCVMVDVHILEASIA